MTGSSDQMVKVWLYDEGVPTHVGAGHAGVVTNVKVSPDGRSVVSTSADGGIFLWRFPHAADIAAPSSVTNSDGSGCNLREQQSDRSRQLSLKKTMPARKENISTISKVQKVRSGNNDVRVKMQTALDGNNIDTTADGSVKCLCQCETTCTYCDKESGDRKNKSSA